ncbi:MAG TPA: DNA-binding protein [Desulfovibrio sp.]|nr:DNA-binding protein [Desulfovibrio sp.]
MNTFLRLGDYNVPGYDLKVTGGMEIYEEDLSGETSGTDTAHKGIKPKTLNVSLNIRFKDKSQLQELIKVLETKDSTGEMKVYTVANQTANAGGITQVKVFERVEWTEQDGLRAWSVNFRLREHLSVPEKVELRQKGAAAVVEKESGQTTGEVQTQNPDTNWKKVIEQVDKVVS